jgi:hypothetical protein
MFGLAGLKAALGGLSAPLALEACAQNLGTAVAQFTGTAELQDDQTILLLRRQPASSLESA